MARQTSCMQHKYQKNAHYMQNFPMHNIMKLMVLLILLTIMTFSCTYIHALTNVLYLHTVEYLVYSLNSKFQ